MFFYFDHFDFTTICIKVNYFFLGSQVRGDRKGVLAYSGLAG